MYIITINVICGICVSKISQLFLHQDIVFPLAQIFIHGNSRYHFPKCWNWQICHAHRAFRLPLCTFRGKLWTFPTVRLKTFGFLLHRTQKYSPVLFWRIPHELLPEKELPSGHYAAYSRAAETCYPTWCTWLHNKRFKNCWKRFAEQLLVHIASCFTRTR